MTGGPLVQSKGPTQTCLEITCFLGSGCPDSGIDKMVAQGFPPMFNLKPVLVFCGCYNKLSQVRGLTLQKFIFSQFQRPEARNQSSRGESPLFQIQLPVALSLPGLVAPSSSLSLQDHKCFFCPCYLSPVPSLMRTFAGHCRIHSDNPG